jgi:hypothetical protein
MTTHVVRHGGVEPATAVSERRGHVMVAPVTTTISQLVTGMRGARLAG